MNTPLLFAIAEMNIMDWLLIFTLLLVCIFITRAVYSIPTIVRNLTQQSALLLIIANHLKCQQHQQPFADGITPEMQSKIDLTRQQYLAGNITEGEYNSTVADIISGK